MLDEHGEGDRQDHRRLAVRRVHGAGTRIGRRPDRVAAHRHASCPVGELFTQLGKGSDADPDFPATFPRDSTARGHPRRRRLEFCGLEGESGAKCRGAVVAVQLHIVIP